jgi:hypothetical protein
MARKSGGENNPFKHGTFAHDLMILRDENADEFTQLHQELIEEWKPVGIAQKAPRSNFQDDESWIQALVARIIELAGAHANFARATLSTYKSNNSTYLRELTAKKITLDERLDARIDKAIKRLAQLKAFKQIVEEQVSRARNDHHSIADHRPQTSTN